MEFHFLEFFRITTSGGSSGGAPLILSKKKKRVTERRKASRASKIGLNQLVFTGSLI